MPLPLRLHSVQAVTWLAPVIQTTFPANAPGGASPLRRSCPSTEALLKAIRSDAMTQSKPSSIIDKKVVAGC